MARTVDDVKLESRAARAKLPPRAAPYWRSIDPGLHLGYRRKPGGGGEWVARRYLGKGSRKDYERETLDGIADDDAKLVANGEKILSYGQALKKVREWFTAKVAPASPTGPITVKQACDSYVAFLKAERKTGKDAEQRLARHVLPELGSYAVSSVTTEALETCKRGMVRKSDDPEKVRKSKDTANRTFSYLRAALNRAFEDSANAIPSDSAWRRVKPFKNVGARREIFLDETQVSRLINVCEGAFRNFVIAALLTGARPPHELAGARVRDFRGDQGTLSLDGKTGRRTVFLTKEAVGFFEELAAGKEPNALLLPKDDGTAWGKNHHVRSMAEAVTKAKLPKETTAYALRHTHASIAVHQGMNLQLLAENMGTSVAMIESHYGKFSKDTRRMLIEQSNVKLGLERGNVAILSR